jgi:hypothetical protein
MDPTIRRFEDDARNSLDIGIPTDHPTGAGVDEGDGMQNIRGIDLLHFPARTAVGGSHDCSQFAGYHGSILVKSMNIVEHIPMRQGILPKPVLLRQETGRQGQAERDECDYVFHHTPLGLEKVTKMARLDGERPWRGVRASTW